MQARRIGTGQSDQELDEQLRFGRATVPGEAEKLLELVDEQAHTLAALAKLLPQRVRRRPHADDAVEGVDVAVAAGLGKRRRHGAQRRLARPHFGDAERRPAAAGAPCQLGQHPA